MDVESHMATLFLADGFSQRLASKNGSSFVEKVYGPVRKPDGTSSQLFLTHNFQIHYSNMGVSINGGTPKSSISRWDFPLKTIQLLGYHHLWKPPYIQIHLKSEIIIKSWPFNQPFPATRLSSPSSSLFSRTFQRLESWAVVISSLDENSR